MRLFRLSKSDMKKIIAITIIAIALTIPSFYVRAEEFNNQQSSSTQQNSESDKNQEQESQDFSSAYDKFDQDRKEFENAKGQYENDSSTSESIRENYVQHSQKVLGSTINVIMQRNSQLRGEIKAKEGYYGNVGKDISGLLDEDNRKLGDYVSKINFATTTSILHQTASEIKTFRGQQQSYLRKLVISAHINRYQETVITNAQNRSRAIEDEINLVKRRGENVSSLENMLAQANTYINQAMYSINDTNDVLGQQTIDSDGLTKIQSLLGGTEQSIKSAYQLFKQIAIDGNVFFSKNFSNETPASIQNSTSTATSTQ